MAHGNEKNKERYYFLKVPQAFFRSLRTRKLKKMPNGHTAILIYLEMMELCADNQFILVYEGVENSIEEELAVKLEEDVGDMKLTFTYLKGLGLLEELSNGDISLPEGHTLVGSISYSGMVKKEQRVRQNLTNVQPLSNYKEKELELELDTNKELEQDKDIDPDNMPF